MRQSQILAVIQKPTDFTKGDLVKVIFHLDKELERKNKILGGRSTSSKSVIFVSDMHVGSSVALAPPHPYNSEAELEIKPNKIMQRFYELWCDCIDHTLNGKPDVMGVVGEPMNGDNYKAVGDQSWTPDFNDQVNSSIELLKMWKAKGIMMVKGTGYHVKRGATNFEEMVARGIGAKRYRAYLGESVSLKDQNNLTALTDYFANFRIGGKVFNLCHHIGFSKNEMYRTTGMARELVTMKLSENFYGKCDVMVRGHVHYHVLVGFHHTKGFTMPAWKLPDGHLFRGGQGGTKPDIGAIECIIEPNRQVIVEPLLKELEIKPLVVDFD